MFTALKLSAALRVVFATACALGLQAGAFAQWATPPGWACGTFNQSGRLEPEDYRKPSHRLRTVETYHYGPNVEALVHPMQKGMTFGSDLDFTLWGYPNHHRALITLTRLAAREKTDKPAGTQFSVECYFARALLIAPDDVIARMIFVRYLGAQQKMPQALSNMKLVVQQAGDNPLTHLNAGLVYMELGAFEEASAQARRVAELGFPSGRLSDELKRKGKWHGPPIPEDKPNSGPVEPSAGTPSQAKPPEAAASSGK
jgi:hypothetical protein